MSYALDFDLILTLLKVTEQARQLPKLQPIHDEAMLQLEDMVEAAREALDDRAEAKKEAEAQAKAEAQAVVAEPVDEPEIDTKPKRMPVVRPAAELPEVRRV